jgi:hypothetical protein
LLQKYQKTLSIFLNLNERYSFPVPKLKRIRLREVGCSIRINTKFIYGGSTMNTDFNFTPADFCPACKSSNEEGVHQKLKLKLRLRDINTLLISYLSLMNKRLQMLLTRLPV